MCPVTMTVLGGVAAAGSLAMNFAGQQAAAGRAADQVGRNNDYKRRLQKFKEDSYLKTATSVRADFAQKTEAMMDRVNQMKRASLFEIEKAHRGARASSSMIAVSRDETAGRTVSALQAEAERLSVETANIVWTNFEGQIRQANREMEGFRAQGQNVLNRAYPDPMQPFEQAPAGPSALALGLNLAAVGFNTGADAMNVYSPTDNPAINSEQARIDTLAQTGQGSADDYMNAVMNNPYGGGG